jgi:glycoside/pentoside/hexuronide:cation symporter, GPH family
MGGLMQADIGAEGAGAAAAGTKTRLGLGTKLLYGTGDWGMASYNTLRSIFYAIFLTDVVGLDPRLASIAAFVGIIWDAINDPLVGYLSDRVHSRWGRRRPFFLFFAVPFGLCFPLLWWAPPWPAQWALALHITLAFMLSDTLQTLVVVPFLSLTPELAPDYDERTSLTSYRMVFNLLASLLTAAGAPELLAAMVKAGYSQQQGYLLVGALFGGLAMLPFLAMFFFLRERQAPAGPDSPSVEAEAQVPPLRETMRRAWSNVPFRYVLALNMLNWTTFDLVALMLPYFLLYWVAGGNLLAQANLLGVKLSIQSAVLGLLFIVAVICVPFWAWLARTTSKRTAYIAGMSFWAVIQFLLLLIRPGQVDLILGLTVLAGISVSTAHVLPDAIFPDVIEWDELRTGQRQEGMYYGAKNFVRKVTGAFATFIALQALGWFGYHAPPLGALQFAQSASALGAIRVLTGPVGSALLFGAILVIWRYPITRERHARMRALLARRQARERG